MNYTQLTKQATKAHKKARVAVVQAEGIAIFEALKEAVDLGICHPVLVGNKDLIQADAKTVGLTDYSIIPTKDEEDSAAKAIHAVREGEADLLMKGKLQTSTLLKAVLHKTEGLRTGKLLSHVAIFETENNKFLTVTDGGMNINPELEHKAVIIQNAVDTLISLGIDTPKVAVLSAVEKVNPDMPSSIDAAALVEMATQGKIKNAIVEGPLSLDLSISKRACEIKGVNSKINGEADILLVPNIVTGNVLGKALILCAKYPSGGLIVGAKCPIILLSRSDTAQEKLNSIVLGVSVVVN